MAGCTSPFPPERIEFDRIITAAGEECARRIPGASVKFVDREGRIHYQATDYGDLPPYQACIRTTMSESKEFLAFMNGRLADNAARAAVATRKRDGQTIVSTTINGVRANLLLDTGAALTVIRPEIAKQAGIEPVSESPRMPMVAVGGRRIAVPMVRARTVGIHKAAVEDMVVGVYDAMPAFPDVDGLLGGNFLNHFNMTIDGTRLVLVPLSTTKPRQEP